MVGAIPAVRPGCSLDFGVVGHIILGGIAPLPGNCLDSLRRPSDAVGMSQPRGSRAEADREPAR